jgi:LAS superfamily LD-carboxypeptidase LdcB
MVKALVTLKSLLFKVRHIRSVTLQTPMIDTSKIGKRVEKRTACAFTQMANAARSAGHNLVINSGFRTMEEQQYFWNCYQTKKCNNGTYYHNIALKQH